MRMTPTPQKGACGTEAAVGSLDLSTNVASQHGVLDYVLARAEYLRNSVEICIAWKSFDLTYTYI